MTDADDKVANRLAFLRVHLDDGVPLARAAREAGIPIRTARRWLACFRDAAAYYAVLLHECGHASGARHRLDRDLSGRFGSAAYAMEECTVELLSAMICADLHLSVEPRPDHASYIASWLEVLRSDKRAIFQAAAHAQRAVAYLHDLQPQATCEQEAA